MFPELKNSIWYSLFQYQWSIATITVCDKQPQNLRDMQKNLFKLTYLKFRDLGQGCLGLKWAFLYVWESADSRLGTQASVYQLVAGWDDWPLFHILFTSLAGLLNHILMVKTDEIEQKYMLVLYKP